MTDAGPAQVAAALLAAYIPAARWRRLSAGAGAKGPRLYDWARVRIRPLNVLWDPDKGYWLLVRRSLTDPTDVAYYVCFGWATTSLEELVRVAGARWAIEAGFEAAKGEVGLADYQVRRYPAWYRHVTLALLAHAYLAVTRTRAAAPDTPELLPLTVPEVRRLLCRLVWAPTAPAEHVPAWSRWRRRHQARARRCHYRRRLRQASA